MMWFFGSTVIWYHTHKQRHTAHSGANRLTYPYKYILISPFMCSQLLSVLHWINNLLISKIYFTESQNVFGFQKVLTCKSHINKSKFFPWNTKNTDRYGAKISKTHTHHSLRER